MLSLRLSTSPGAPRESAPSQGGHLAPSSQLPAVEAWHPGPASPESRLPTGLPTLAPGREVESSRDRPCHPGQAGRGWGTLGPQAESLEEGRPLTPPSWKTRKDPFASTSWQVGGRLPPVGTPRPKRIPGSLSVSPAKAWVQVYLGEKNAGRTREAAA